MASNEELADKSFKSNMSQRFNAAKDKVDVKYFKEKFRSARYLIIGREINEGLLFKAFLYITFIATAYIYLEPILTMIVNMVMSNNDLFDPTVVWIPSGIYLGHLARAWDILSYGTAFGVSMFISLTAAIFHCLTCGLAGYALARLDFPFKKFVFALVVLAFIVPQQVIVLPTIIAYNALDLTNNLFALILPSLFGFGVKGALFVIIFRQFFLTQPKELIEAARIDGATAMKFYFKVMLPLAKPAILVVFLLSFVWTWNDTYLPRMYLSGNYEYLPLATELYNMDSAITSLLDNNQIAPFAANAIKLSAGFLAILPPLLFYIFVQKQFVSGIEQTGIMEE